MTSNLMEEKDWWQRNWKWSIALSIFFLLLMSTVFSSSFGTIVADYTKAYANPALYEIPLEKVSDNQRVKEILGAIEPIDHMTILNGEVIYSENNTSVKSTIKITGEHGKAMLDIIAILENEVWLYKTINVRIKNPPEKKETIQIIQ